MCKAAAELGSPGGPLSEPYRQTQGARGARCCQRLHPVLGSCAFSLRAQLRQRCCRTHCKRFTCSEFLFTEADLLQLVAPRVGSLLPADPRVVSGSEPHSQVCLLGGSFCHLRAIRQQRGAAVAVCIPAAGTGWTPQ